MTSSLDETNTNIDAIKKAQKKVDKKLKDANGEEDTKIAALEEG